MNNTFLFVRMSVAAVIVTAIAATFVLVPSPVQAESGLTCSQLIELLIAIDVIPADKINAARLLCGSVPPTTPTTPIPPTTPTTPIPPTTPTTPIPPTTQTLSLFSPNGGEAWKVGESREIRWTTADATSSVIIEAVPQPIYCIRAPCPQQGNTFRISNGVTSAKKGSYVWKVGTNAQGVQQIEKEGQWRVVVRQPQNNGSTNTVSDESDKTFTISTDSRSPYADLKILRESEVAIWDDGPIYRPAGTQMSMRWTSANIGACAVFSSDGSFYKYGTSGDALITIPSHSVTYSIECTNIGGGYVVVSDKLEINPSDGGGVTPVTIKLSASKNGQQSEDPIYMNTGDVVVFSAIPSNLKGTNYFADYSRAWFFDPMLHGACSDNNNSTWGLSCKPTTNGTSKVYVEVYQNNHTYRSNIITIIVGATTPKPVPVPEISVWYPKTGEAWKTGETKVIQWSDSRGLMGHKYAINAHSPDGKWMGRISDGVLNEGAFKWTVGKLLNTDAVLSPSQYRIYVGDITETYGPSGLSGVFTINVTTPTAPLTVVSPNGGETWNVGENKNITWQNNSPVSTCSPEAYCAMPAPKYYDIQLVPYYPPCTGNICPLYPYRAPYTIAKNVFGFSYSWAVGKVMDTFANNTALEGSYTVRVCQINSSICDSSDSYFKITGQTIQQSITILSPNGGETYKQGSAMSIMWKKTDLSPSAVNIVLYDVAWGPDNDRGTSIATNVPNTGSYSWSVPTSVATGKNYKIYVYDNANPKTFDVSDATFSITSSVVVPSALIVVSGNNGEVTSADAKPYFGVLRGTPLKVAWSSRGAQACSISDGAGFWFNASSGSQPHTPSQTTTYLLECFKDGDRVASASVRVEVSTAIPVACTGIGDIDGDGKILASDALYVLRYNAGTVTLTPEQICRADANRDGRVDAVDTDLILKASVGSVTLPVVSRIDVEAQTASLARRTQEIATSVMYVIGHWYKGFTMPISADGTRTVGDSLSASVGGLLSNYAYLLTNWHKAYAFN